MNHRLWAGIEAFSFDRIGTELKFKARLARENGWSESFAERAIEEYRRFIYLCCEAGHPCSPSDVVDQVWHLHLCYTRSYWIDLCHETLGRQLHHGPTQGGVAEAEKFSDWYGQTLQSYQKAFGCLPTADLWPSVAGYSRQSDYRRVDLRQNWVLSKQKVQGLFAIGAVSSAMVGCGAITSVATEIPFPVIFIGGVILFMIVMRLRKARGKARGKGGPGGCGGGCSSGCGSDSGCGGCGGD